MSTPASLAEAINATREAIDHLYEPSEAQNIANYYFQDAFGLSNPDATLTSTQLTQWQSDLARLSAGTPLQYVVGVAPFYGHSFMVTPDVLIPRPETEELVRHSIQTLKTYMRPASVLDIGTGSGCIPISIKRALPSKAMVTTIDISQAALTVAIDNSQVLDAHIKIKNIDVLDPTQTQALSRYDLIVSNPPYIPETERASMAEQVTQHEPNLALFVPDGDPLRFYRRIFELCADHLAPDGYILLEVHEERAKEVLDLAQAMLDNIDGEILDDLQGKQRIVAISAGI